MGMPATMHYKLDVERLQEMIEEGYSLQETRKQENQQASLQKPCKQDCGNPANKIAETLQTSESTAQTTTETTTLPADAGETSRPSSSPETPKESPRQRLARLRSQTGGDYLGLAAYCEEKQTRPASWTTPTHDATPFAGAPLTAFCRLARIPLESLSPKKRGQYAAQLAKIAADWHDEDGLPLIDAASLALCVDALGESEFGFKAYSTPYQQSFAADLGVLIARHIAGEPLVEEKKASKRKRSPLVDGGSWPEESERRSAWAVHGDWIVSFFEEKRRAVVAEFGDDRYLSTVLYREQVAEERGISQRQADALICAYDRWSAQSEEAVNIEAFVEKKAAA